MDGLVDDAQVERLLAVAETEVRPFAELGAVRFVLRVLIVTAPKGISPPAARRGPDGAVRSSLGPAGAELGIRQEG